MRVLPGDSHGPQSVTLPTGRAQLVRSHDRQGAGKVGATAAPEPPFSRVRFSTNSPALTTSSNSDTRAIKTAYSPLRGEMGCKTMQLNRVDCNVGNSPIDRKNASDSCFCGCGVVATHQLPKGFWCYRIPRLQTNTKCNPFPRVDGIPALPGSEETVVCTHFQKRSGYRFSYSRFGSVVHGTQPNLRLARSKKPRTNDH